MEKGMLKKEIKEQLEDEVNQKRHKTSAQLCGWWQELGSIQI